MLIFIDDSGDPAFKMAQGSTKYLVIAGAIFYENSKAEEVSLAIEKYRTLLGFGSNHEFKFNKSSEKIRLDFLKEVSNFDFIVRAIAIDKSQIYSNFLIQNQKSLYNFAIKEVISKSKHLLKDARIKLDGKASREVKGAFNKYLREQINTQDSRYISGVKFVDSRTDNLIQLADMFAGAIRRSFEGEDADIYRAALYKITAKENSDIWEFK